MMFTSLFGSGVDSTTCLTPTTNHLDLACSYTIRMNLGFDRYIESTPSDR